MSPFHLYTTEQVAQYTNPRSGETKLGQTLLSPTGTQLDKILEDTPARFIVLGIPEDVGVRANLGVGGTHTTWENFLKSFLNVQHTHKLPGNAIMLLGAFRLDTLLSNAQNVDIHNLRALTQEIDDTVFPVIEKIIQHNKIPIVIGGGHNNAYPLLKGSSLGLGKSVHAINLDAHSDFRIEEGRHSGNGFRYAYNQNYLKNYAMLGLHEAYNSSAITEELIQNPNMLPIFWEDIFLRNKATWLQAIEQGIQFVNNQPFGVELDVDAIEQVLSSAATPMGINPQQAAQYLYLCGKQSNAIYLHLPEGVVQRADGLENKFTGKLLSYLSQSFIKGVLEQ